MAAFWDFLSSKKSEKNKGTIVIPTFKIDITKVPLFFRIFYPLEPKIEICLKYFLDKSWQKLPKTAIVVIK